jgi:DNA-binding transcriptional regulator YdaS (Cro superfamily)
MNLTTYLLENKIKPTHLAKQAGIAPAVVTRYLRGERGISAQTARKISRATQGSVSLEELLFIDCNHLS